MWLLSTVCVLLGTIFLVKSQSVYYNCPKGWVVDTSNRRCYNFVFYPKLAYVLAARACGESYSSLLSVSSSGKHSFVNEYLLQFDANRNEWYTSGKKESSNQYIWEGEGIYLESTVNWWSLGYQSMQGNRLIYKYDTTQNGYRWNIGQDTIARSYICEISQEEAYRVLIQRRDFTFGTPYLNPEETSYGPTFDPDGVPENLWFLSTSKSLFLECLAIGNPQPMYRWLRGPTINNIKEEVKTSTDARYTLTNGKLTIQYPTNSDAKFYRCEASNTQGKIVSNYAQLSLGNLGEFSNVADAPVTAMAYAGAMIICSNIHYEPAVTYNWNRGRGSLSSEPIFMETAPYIFISANGRIYFSEVTKNDEADYFCIASLSGISSSVVGTAQPPSATSRPIKLTVLDQAARGDWGPIFQDDFVNVFPNPPARGLDISLECFAYGTSVDYKNNWNFVWTRVGGLPSKVKFENFNRVLKIENAQAEDEGIYRCTVTRGSGSDFRDFTLILNTKPYFLMELKHQHIDIGSQLSWQCLADGNPYPAYSWFRNGTLIPADDPDVILRRNILIINNADPNKHNGMYQCAATNILGQVLSSAQLRVLAFKPTFTKNPLPESLSGAVRGNITIPCMPEASPKPEIKWSRRDRFGGIQDLAVTVNTGTTDTNAHYQMTMNGELVITNIANDDAGYYICTATNDYGEDQSVCELTVETGTTLFRKPNLLYDTYYQNDTVFIQCEASYDPDLDLIYVWSFNGKRIDMEKEAYFFTQSLNPAGLYIKPLQYYHEGDYECTALTPLNSESAEGKLLVKGVPEAPSGLYGDSGRVTTNSLIMYWTTGTDRGHPILEYEIVYNVESEPGQWFLATDPGQKIFHVDTQIPDATVDTRRRTYTLTSLLPGNNYRFKIRSKNIKGWSEYSQISANYRTLAAKPDINYHQVFLNLTGGGGSVGDLTIKWNPLPKKYHGGPELYYRIYWRRSSTEVWNAHNIQAQDDDMKKGQLTFVTLVGDKNYYLPYYVMIQPCNSIGKGDNSSQTIIYSAEGMPVPAPKIATCSAVNATAMDVYWTPITNTRESIGGRIAGFQVNYWVKKDPSDPRPEYKWFMRFYVHDGVVPEYGTVIGLKMNDFTIFDVQVFNTAGLGPKSDPYPCETAADPQVAYPTEVNVHPWDSTSVKITWRGVLTKTLESTVTGYKIFLWPANENFRRAVEYMANFMPTEYRLTGLESGTVYALRISAHSPGGDGQKSQTVYFAIAGGPATLIDQTVTEFQPLAASSITSSLVVILTAIFVLLLT